MCEPKCDTCTCKPKPQAVLVSIDLTPQQPETD